MRTKIFQLLLVALLFQAKASYALDSYRYLHVSLGTIWYIFIGLMIVILFPFVLMAYLAWYYSNKKSSEKRGEGN
jgi:heme/copper-type cytochrome/quinol oxidase subunit 2